MQANAIQAALKAAIGTVTASRSVISSVSTAIRGVSFPGLAVAAAASAAAGGGGNPKALLRNLIAMTQPAAAAAAAGGGRSAPTSSSTGAVPSLSSLGYYGQGSVGHPAPAAGSATPTGGVKRAAAAAAAAGAAAAGGEPGTPAMTAGGVLGALGSGARVGASRPSVPDATPKILAKIQGGGGR